jgi:hypothetical protein
MVVPTHSVVPMNVQQQFAPLQVAELHMPPPVAALVVPLATALMALDVAADIDDDACCVLDAWVDDAAPPVPLAALPPVPLAVPIPPTPTQGCTLSLFELPLEQLMTRQTPATNEPRPCQNVQRMNGKRNAIPPRNASVASQMRAVRCCEWRGTSPRPTRQFDSRSIGAPAPIAAYLHFPPKS